MTGFTKGPWVQFEAGDDGLITIMPAMREGEIAVIDTGQLATYDEASANARLIAAAPDLYEALKAADRWLSGLVAHKGRCSVHGGPCTCGLEAARAQVRAALAKAAPETGEAE